MKESFCNKVSVRVTVYVIFENNVFTGHISHTNQNTVPFRICKTRILNMRSFIVEEKSVISRVLNGRVFNRTIINIFKKNSAICTVFNGNFLDLTRLARSNRESVLRGILDKNVLDSDVVRIFITFDL